MYRLCRTKREIALVTNAYKRYLHLLQNSPLTLYDCYKHPSSSKYLAYQHWQARLDDICIISHNHHTFTVAGIPRVYGKKYFAYITHANNYIIAIDDIKTN